MRISFLGLVLNETLSWKSHVNKISMKILHVIGAMRRIKRIVNLGILLKIYNSLILSRIHFSILCWATENKRIFKLQKKVTRIISKSSYNTHTDPLFKKHKLLKVKDIFSIQCLKFYYNYCHQKTPKYFNGMFHNIDTIHNHNTRRGYTIHTPSSKLQGTTRSIRYYLPKIANDFPHNITIKIRTHSLPTIKQNSKNYLIDKYEVNCLKVRCYICRR